MSKLREEPQPKECATCENAFVRRDREALRNFRARKYCSRHCQDIGNSQRMRNARKARYCANPACRKLLVQREGEQNQNFNKRISCDRACGRMVIIARGHGFVSPEDYDDSSFPAVNARDNADFSGQNILVKPMITKIAGPAHNYSISGSSMGWTAAVGGDV